MAEEIKTESKEKIDTTLQFYFNPIEPIRMLRYFPYQAKFDNITLPVNKELIYKDQNINVGVLIHIDENTNSKHLNLQLDSLVKFNKLDFNILVFYTKDCLTKELEAVLSSHPVERIEQPERLWKKDGIGDMNELDAIYQGLSWAKDKNIDILIKLDSELIGLFNWIDSFKKLAFETDGLTFSSYGSEWKNFRKECIGFNVKWWTTDPVKFSFIWLLQNKCTVESTIWLHEMSKILDGKNYSSKKLAYLSEKCMDYLHSGYVTWLDLLGTNEKTMDNRHNNVLWKDYSSEEEYQK